MLFFSLGSAFAFGEVEDFRLNSYYILFLDTFCFDFFVFVGGRKLFRSCMSAFHGLNFFLFENPYRPLQYSLSGSFSEDWFPEGSLFAWTLKYFNCKGIFIDFFFTIGFNGVVLKVFVNPCLFPWVCHARLFCFFKLQSVSLWYSCSDSLNLFLDNTLIFHRCPILRGLLFTARKLWLALLFRKTCRRLLFGFFVEPYRLSQQCPALIRL